MDKKLIGILFLTLIIVVIIAFVAANWNWIIGIFEKKCKPEDTPFECVKKLGATPTSAESAGDRYDYPNSAAGSYGFYSNNRSVIIGSAPAKKGTYDKEKIKWDDGSVTYLSDIFKRYKYKG